jgi:hypothetical protein
MRQTISGLVAAVAVMTAGAAPALACGFTSCSPGGQEYASPCAQTYVPSVVGTGCNTGCGGGWAYDRLAEPTTQYYPTTQYQPTTQYYYVNQGPTYSGPGMFAPHPTYQENAVGTYERAPSYYGWHRHYHHSYRYDYAPRHYGYMPRHTYRYGYMPHRYGYGYPLRRYY